jgi:hypothetical protein
MENLSHLIWILSGLKFKFGKKMADLLSQYQNELEFYIGAIAILPEKTPESIREFIKNNNHFPTGVVPEDVLEIICKIIEEQYDITQDKGFSVTENHKPWLKGKKSNIDFHYWDRCRRYLLKDEKIPDNVVNILDNTSDEILDYCGNPEAENLKRRGMVMGHVQSGKTMSYACLICKAADAGYKVIILLTGMSNLLRAQTQKRLDDYFIGRSSDRPGEILGAANRSIGLPKHPVFATTVIHDFSIANANTLGVTLHNINEPIIFIIKKNINPIRNLSEWLSTFIVGETVKQPLLLIDDEADNASINTSRHQDKITAINNGIRGILALFSKSSYVGYTATPFANIFINAYSDSDMVNDDLFPSNFIKLLDPPSNYKGPDKIFGREEEEYSNIIRQVIDNEDLLPSIQRRDFVFRGIPESLKKAVRLFVLCRTIRVLQGKGKKHCTMMVNVSYLNVIQEMVNGEISTYLADMKSAINVHSGLGDRGLENEFLKSLKDDYNEEYINFKDDNFDNKWELIQKTLKVGIGSVFVQSVNMSSGKLVYDDDQDGLHVIAVGGFALSRGLTLEGLCISYMLRNASAYDTLMQMGRWFGYREGYAELCRIFLTPISIDYYISVTRIVDDLRNEIQIMESLKQTPMDFGLKIRHNPHAISISARNKMRNAERRPYAIDLSGTVKEGHTLYSDQESNRQNLDTIKEFIASLGDCSVNEEIWKSRFFWENVEVHKIMALIKKFKLPSKNAELGVNIGDSRTGYKTIVHSYIEDRLVELGKWDVALPPGKNEDHPEQELLENKTIYCRERFSGMLHLPEKNFYSITRRRRVAVGSGGDAKWGLNKNILVDRYSTDRQLNSLRTKPLLVIQAFKARLADIEEDNFELDSSICVTISLFFPETEIPVDEKEYYFNSVAIKELIDQIGEEDSEDDDITIAMQ